MCKIEKVYDLAKQSLEEVRNSLENSELTDEQVIEFYETFKKDIVEMLDIKILKLYETKLQESTDKHLYFVQHLNL